LPDLLADVDEHLPINGPWQFTLATLDDDPAVTTAVEKIAAAEHGKAAA
jgi:hypothetical protein